MFGKKNKVVHIKAWKQYLDYGQVLEKVLRVFRFNQEVWLKPCIDMNRKPRKKAKNELVKDFVKLMNNCVWEY